MHETGDDPTSAHEPPDHDGAAAARWKHDGVRVIPGDRLDPNTAQTPGMFRQAAVNAARVGAQKIWAGTVAIEPDAKTGVHHHGALESVIYIVSGRARMRWGERLEYVAEAGPGDFIFVPPYVRTRRSTPRPTSPCTACWYAPTTRRWWSTCPTSRRPSGPRPSTGSIRSTSDREASPR